MNLQDYYFPVTERKVHRTNGDILPNYKLIVREDTDEPISIVSADYKLVPNQELIESLLETIDKTGIKYELYGGPNHNFIDNNRMKLVLLLPELKIKDDTNDGIGMSLYIHNSYDMSERIRVIFGMLRYICSNGAIVFQKEQQTHRKHTKNFEVEVLKHRFDNAYRMIPQIQERIKILEMLESKQVISENINYAKENISVGMAEYAEQQNILNLWQLYNAYTYYVTHNLAVRQHTNYQTQISKLFKL